VGVVNMADGALQGAAAAAAAAAVSSYRICGC